MDVAKKLVILAREIGFKASLDDVDVENLIPSPLRTLESIHQFNSKEEDLNSHYISIKDSIKDDEVLRYVAELNVNEKTLAVKLIAVNKSDSLAHIKNADNYFEVFTESYQKQPIIIQGKGAGPIVTARGVYSDVLKLV